MAGEGDHQEGLSHALLRVAGEPAKLGALYEILGDYCHALRNRLNSIKLSLFLARRQACPLADSAWAEAESSYRAVEQFVEQLQAICRPMALFAIPLDLNALVAERLPSWRDELGRRGRALEVEAPDGPAVGRLDPARLTQALDSFVAWRARSGARSSVRLRWGADDDHLALEWHDPQGTDPDDATGALAMPLLARVVAAHGGRCQLDDESGLRLRCRWPRHATHP